MPVSNAGTREEHTSKVGGKLKDREEAISDTPDNCRKTKNKTTAQPLADILGIFISVHSNDSGRRKAQSAKIDTLNGLSRRKQTYDIVWIVVRPGCIEFCRLASSHNMLELYDMFPFSSHWTCVTTHITSEKVRSHQKFVKTLKNAPRSV